LPISMRRAVEPLVGYGADVQRLGIGLLLGGARFQQQHVNAAADELQCHADARCARADDAHIGQQWSIIRKIIDVYDHAGYSRRRRNSDSGTDRMIHMIGRQNQGV